MRTRANMLPLLGLAGLLATAGCGAGWVRGDLTLWAVGESQRVFPDSPVLDETDCFSSRLRRIKLFAAINEVVGSQVVLTAGAQPLTGVQLRVDDFVSGQHRIDAGRVRLYRQWFVPVTEYPSWYLLHGPSPSAPREFADVLVPLEGGLSVPAGRNQPVWMDISVPLGTEPGIYRSRLVAWSGGRQLAQVGIELEVWPFALPSQSHLPLLVGLDVRRLLGRHLWRDGRPYVPTRLSADEPMRQQAIKVIRQGLALLHEHRCSGYLTGYWPAVRQDRMGRALVEWSDYDELVGPYIDGSAFADKVPAAAWPMPIGVDFPRAESYGGADTERYWRFLGSYLTECVRHFEQQGWLGQALAWYDTPVPNSPADYRRFRRFAKLAEATETPVRVVGSLLPQSMSPYGWPGCYYEDVSELVDVWAMPGRFYDPATMRQLRQGGAQTWLRVDSPPFAGTMVLAAPPAMVRAIPWQALRCAADGVLIDRGVDWPAAPGAGDGRRAGHSGGDWLLWPGSEAGLDVPIGSIRLKQLRRGLQDYEYLWLLRQHDRPELADLVAACLVKYVGTDAYRDNYLDGRTDSVVLDPELWSLARRLMGQELARAMGGAEPEPLERFAQRLGWRRLLAATRHLRLTVDGVRVHATPDEQTAWGVRIWVTVRNELGQAVEGVLRLGSIPAGWQSVGGQVRVGPLEPLAAARASLAFEAAYLDTDQYGVMPLEVVFDAGMAGLVRAEARLSAFSVPRLAEPIVVDGDAADWPVGLSNMAGDFVLFGGGRATQQTLAFAVRDERNLYLLIHCLEQRMDRVRGDRSNVVGYDGLVPVGQDLVEILLDPHHTGTGDSGDLYYLLVKHNGVVIAQRGVGVDPPIGERAAWPVRARAYVSDFRDRWIVELAIPLSAFEGWALAEPVWGLNIARFQARLGEYSSWSAARRYMYNTRSLGNLIWSAAGAAGR